MQGGGEDIHVNFVDAILMYNTWLHMIIFRAFRNSKSTSCKTHYSHMMHDWFCLNLSISEETCWSFVRYLYFLLSSVSTCDDTSFNWNLDSANCSKSSNAFSWLCSYAFRSKFHVCWLFLCTKIHFMNLGVRVVITIKKHHIKQLFCFLCFQLQIWYRICSKKKKNTYVDVSWFQTWLRLLF